MYCCTTRFDLTTGSYDELFRALVDAFFDAVRFRRANAAASETGAASSAGTASALVLSSAAGAAGASPPVHTLRSASVRKIPSPRARFPGFTIHSPRASFTLFQSPRSDGGVAPLGAGARPALASSAPAESP